MSASRTASRLLRLYPRDWRARYGEELQALIVDMSSGRRVPWRVRADVAGAGGRERLRATGLGGGDGSSSDRARGGVSLVLWAWALFMVAGLLIQKASEHWQDVLSTRGHATATVAFDALGSLAVVGGLLVLAGIALTVPALLRFLRGGGLPRIRRIVLVAGALTLALALATGGVVLWAHGLSARDRNGHDIAYAIGVLAWALLGTATLAAWTTAATRTAACLDLRPELLRLEARLAVAVSTAMVAMTAATAVWWVAVARTSPAALVGSMGPHGSAAAPQLILAAALMVVAATLGGAGASRAARAV